MHGAMAHTISALALALLLRNNVITLSATILYRCNMIRRLADTIVHHVADAAHRLCFA